MDCFLRLRNAFSDKIDVQWVCTLNRTFDFEADIIIRNIGMEGNTEVQVLMRQQIALHWGYGKVLAAEGGIPLEFRSNITKVGKLDGLADLGVDYNSSKPNSILHQLHLDAMSSCIDIQ